MNAHAKPAPSEEVGPIRHDPIRAECERMLGILDAHIADLDEVLQGLKEKRKLWVGRLDALDARPAPASRAAHGAVRLTILRELRAQEDGLDLNKLSKRVTRALPSVHPRSIRQALTRLLEQGEVSSDGVVWRAMH